MKNIIERIVFMFTYSEDIKRLIISNKKKREAKEFDEERSRLHLCIKHRQERNQSHYSEQNCAYCILLKTLKEREQYIDRTR